MVELVYTGNLKFPARFPARNGMSVQIRPRSPRKMNQEIFNWVDDRIKQMLASPRAYGSDEAVEMQILLLLEMRFVETKFDVVEAYKTYLNKTFPKKPNRPLHRIVETDHLGNNIAIELRKAVAELTK